MKNLILAIIALVVFNSVFAQEFNVSGDVAYYTKNLSTATGLMFSEDPALVLHMNASIEYNKFNVSAAYSGHMGMQRIKHGDHFNMLDLSAGYKIGKEFGLCAGYELTYTDTDKDEIGHGVFAMATYNKNVVSSTFIFFADPTFKNTYYIASADVKVGKNVSVYSLGGYTNTKAKPWYGLAGLKYSKGNFFVGTYYVFDEDNPGHLCGVGIKF